MNSTAMNIRMFPMTNVIYVLIWETWRRVRGPFLIQLGLSILFPLALSLLVDLSQPASTGLGDAMTGMVMFLVFFLVVISPASSGQSVRRLGFQYHYGYGLPIPDWLLTTVPMLSLGLMAALAFAIPMTVINQVYGLTVPILSWAFVCLSVTLCYVALNWWNGFRSVNTASWWAFSLLMVLWLNARETQDEDFLADGWSQAPFASEYMLIFFALMVTALLLTIYGVSRQRRGEFLDSDAVYRASTATLVPGLSYPCPVNSPVKAELWRILRQRLMNTLNSSLVFGVLAAIMIALMTGGEESILANIMAMSLVLLVTFLVLCCAGTFEVCYDNTTVPVRLFDRLRPMSTLKLATLKLGVTLVLSMVGSLILLGVVAASLPLIFDDLSSVQESLQPYWMAVANLSTWEFLTRSLLLLSLIVTGLIALAVLSTASALFPRRLVWSIVGVLIYIPVSLSLADMILPWGNEAGRINLSPDNPVILNYLKVHAVIVCAIILTSLAQVFRSLLRDRILQWRAVVALGVVWVLLVLPGFSNLFGQILVNSGVSSIFRATLACLSLVPLLIVMLAPWIVSRMRHQ